MSRAATYSPESSPSESGLDLPEDNDDLSMSGIGASDSERAGSSQLGDYGLSDYSTQDEELDEDEEELAQEQQQQQQVPQHQLVWARGSSRDGQVIDEGDDLEDDDSVVEGYNYDSEFQGHDDHSVSGSSRVVEAQGVRGSTTDIEGGSGRSVITIDSPVQVPPAVASPSPAPPSIQSISSWPSPDPAPLHLLSATPSPLASSLDAYYDNASTDLDEEDDDGLDLDDDFDGNHIPDYISLDAEEEAELADVLANLSDNIDLRDDFGSEDDDGGLFVGDEVDDEDEENQQPQAPGLHHHHHHHHHYHPRLRVIHDQNASAFPRFPANPFLPQSPAYHLLPAHLHQNNRLSNSPIRFASPFGDFHSPHPRSVSPLVVNGRMDRGGRAGRLPRDQLVDVEVGTPGEARRSRSRNNHPMQPPQARAGPAPEVIDLTGDFDDEDEHIQASQNARRQNSQRREGAAPRLNRSDSSYIGNHPVIVVSDSDEEVAAIPPPPRRASRIRHRSMEAQHNGQYGPNGPNGPVQNQLPNPNQLPPRFPGMRGSFHGFLQAAMPFNHLFGWDRVNRPQANIQPNLHRPQDVDELLILGNAHNIPIPPIGDIELNYRRLPFPNMEPNGVPGGLAARKPQHEPPPSAREGFTRDTNEDSVIICPSCDEELAFDPNDDDGNAPPAKKPRTKKDQAEHHFWAVKACGHVYCKRCYDNRKPSARNPVKVGFQASDKKISCAVDGCGSDVTGKTAWVGIFI